MARVFEKLNFKGQPQILLINAPASFAGEVVLCLPTLKAAPKRYRCDFNRDSGWGMLRNSGFDTVRQIAIDEDWTALRFRRNEFIKTSTKTQK